MANTSETSQAPAEASSAAGAAASKEPAKKAQPEHKDSFRESLETVVFVVFLVLLLKAFVAEAFVIPTGSMATTLLGEHCDVACERCGYTYVVNAQQDNQTLPTVTVICPNCRHTIENFPVSSTGGDKVLVLKPQYDFALPNRHDVIVFKFPGQPEYIHNEHDPDASDRRSGGPQKDYTAFNYIKRLWGIPGDRLAIWYGDVHQRIGLKDQEKLRIIRRTPNKYLSMRRIVSHFDYQDANLALPPRWSDEGSTPGWKLHDDKKSFQHSSDEKRHWLTFRNYLRPERASAHEHEIQGKERQLEELETALNKRLFRPDQESDLKGDIARLKTDIKDARERLDKAFKESSRPQLITDFLEYNSGYSYNWTPDLMLECDVHLTSAGGELVLELAGGVDLHQAIFDLSDGSCTLKTTRDGKALAFVDADGKDLPSDQSRAPTKLGKTGKHSVRFCSFDQRLTLWVDGKLTFGDGLIFPPPKDDERGPRMIDLRPVRIGVTKGTVKVARLQVYRDIYYTRETPSADVGFGGPERLALTAEEERQLVEKELARLTDAQRQLPADMQRLIAEQKARPDKWSAYYPSRVGGSMPDQKNYPVVHPTHHPQEELGPDEFFALGDNSTQSSDSRAWGQVPRRLLLGKAVSVYWPIPSRFGLIR